MTISHNTFTPGERVLTFKLNKVTCRHPITYFIVVSSGNIDYQ